MLVRATTSAAQVISVPAGGDLQKALNEARPGDQILLQPGALYVGSFVLPAHFGDDTRPKVLRTAGPDAVRAGQRMSPKAGAGLAKIQSADTRPALLTSPGTRFWRIELLEFRANKNGEGDIITLGDGSRAQNTLDRIPSDIVIDRIYMHGDPVHGQKRGIALNSTKTTITNSYIADIMVQGQDSQAVGGWNGPGGYLIENNWLEAAGENLMFGGGDPAIPNLVPTDIVIRRNTLSKPLEWRTRTPAWQVKNLLELKNARNVLIEYNLLERNWRHAQSGYSILFTVRNQDGECPWCQVENVEFRYNVVRDVAAGIAILGTDYIHPSKQTNRIYIRHNVFDGLDQSWGGDGVLLLITDGPRDVVLDHNTVIQGRSSGIAKFDEKPIEGFVFTNNVVSHGEYGMIAANRGPGNDTIRMVLPGSQITHNVIAGGEARLHPPGNLFPTMEEFRRQFVSFDARDYRLSPESRWRRGGADGRDIGADMQALAGLSPPRPRAVPRTP
jgi:hypothetical protein